MNEVTAYQYLEEIPRKARLPRIDQQQTITKCTNCLRQNLQESHFDFDRKFGLGMSDLDARCQSTDLVLPAATCCQQLLKVQNLQLTDHENGLIGYIYLFLFQTEGLSSSK